VHTLIWLTLLWGGRAFPQEREGFVVTFYDKKVKIVAPANAASDLAVALENITLGPLAGKLVTGTGELITYFTLESKAHKNIIVGEHLKKRVFIIPLNPPGQDIELKLGQSAYEIPPSEN